MKERDHSPTCERASDLVAFIYDEADEREAQDFEFHLRDCSVCREEAASFGVVRESITTWRDEALAGFVSTSMTTKTNRKSALAALRQFFDLSPLWLESVISLGICLFCLLLGIFIYRTPGRQVVRTNPNPNAIYTQEDINRLLNEALAKQKESMKPLVEAPAEKSQTVQNQKHKTVRRSSSDQFAKSRRPLSRAEREQLAADLRLLSTIEDEPLQLLGDRINQE